MKNFIKFTSAAAALVMLASCSNDDLFGGQNAGAVVYEEGDLIVNVEPVKGPASTRAISNEDMTVVNWEKTDYIKVFDSEVHKWDRYGFNGSKFVIDGDQDLENAMFALYPFGIDKVGEEYVGDDTDGGVVNTHWTKGGTTTADMKIPHTLTYKEGKLADGTNAYWCSLPQWGTVSSTDGKLETNLKYMTAILRVRLANVKGSDARYLHIRAYKDEALTKEIALSGTFTATLDTENPEKTALEEKLTTEDGAMADGITVSLYGAEEPNSVVFVPIVPCSNAILVIDYLDAGHNPIDPTLVPEAKAKKLSQKNYVRGTLYKAKGAEFTVSSGKPSDISNAIRGAKTQENPEITATIETEATPDDNQIIIPEGTTAEEITLNLKKIDTSANILYIEDENVANPYKGVITINIEENAVGTNNIVAQTKGATVQFAGKNYTAAPLKAFVKELVIGNGNDADATNVAIAELGAMVEAASVKAKATVDAITAPADNKLAEVLVEGTVTGDIIANTNEDVATAVTVNGGATGDIKTTGDVTVADGTVGAIGTSSVLASSITITASEGKTATSTTANTKGSFNVSGAGASVTGISRVYGGKDATDVVINITDLASIKNLRTYGTDKEDATPAAITVSGDAKVGNIEAPASEVTINSTTALTYTGNIEAARLNAKGKSALTGNITTGKLVIRGAASVEDATVSDNVSIKLDEEGEAVKGTLYVAQENVEGQGITISNGYVKAIDLKTNGAKKDVALKFGKALVAVATVTPNTDATLGKVVPSASAWDGQVIDKTKPAFNQYRQSPQIWTASQLASMEQTELTTLKNDLNLGNTTAWTMPEIKNYNFHGEGHTITGGKIVAKDNNGTGLFSSTLGNRSVQNLIVKDVEIESNGFSNVGVLVGIAKQNIEIKIVDVSTKSFNVTGEGADKANNIGGLVGNIQGNAEIGKGAAVNAVKVKLNALAGQYNVGGLVGYIKGTSTINNTTVEITNGITFTPTKNEPTVEDARNENAGSIGMFIGKSDDDVTIDKVNPAANDKVVTNRTALGFKLDFQKDASSNTYYYFGGKNTEVGKFGAADKTLKIVATTITTITNKTANNLYKGVDDTKCIDWTGKDTESQNVANATFGIFVASKAWAATDVK